MPAKFNHWTNIDRASALIWFSSLLLSLTIRCYWQWPANCEPLFGLQLLLAHFLATPLVTLWSGLNLVLYDLFTQQMGPWTAVTASAYGLVSWLASKFMQRPVNGPMLASANAAAQYQQRVSATQRRPLRHYLLFTLIATVLYDLITASMGPLWWQQSWSAMLWGQIPFTVYHLLSNFASAVSVYALLALLQQLLAPTAHSNSSTNSATLWHKLLKFFGHLIHPFN